jgi:histidinol-phosphate aminotransferase
MSTSTFVESFNTGFTTDLTALRLHLNESPYGQPAAAREAALAELRERLSVYPDSDCAALRARIAEHHGVSADMVAVGNGVDELVLLSALTFLPAGGTALVTETTFPGYRAASAVAGGSVRAVPLADFRVEPSGFGAALTEDVDLAYVCNPVNPTGTVLDRAGVEQIIDDAERAGTVVVFDEAYVDFAGPEHEHAMNAARAGRRVLALRTFSKAWGLAALRVGYAIGPAELIGRLWQTRQALPFNVNRPALHAAVAALDDHEFLPGVRTRTAQAREHLYRRVTELGLGYVPSVTNFVLVRLGGDSEVVAKRLSAEHQVLVRDLTRFGLPGCLRVSVGTIEQIDRFYLALANVLTGADPTGLASVATGETPAPTLDPIEPATLFNGYVGAHVVHALYELGVWDRLEGPPVPVSALAESIGAGVDVERLRALLRTVALLGYVELRPEGVTLTDTGREIVRTKGYFVWGVGGYQGVLRSLADLTSGRLTCDSESLRDVSRVVLGSGNIGRRVMRPIEDGVLDSIEFGSFADLGCGDGTRAVRLAGRPSVHTGLAIDISATACELATRRVAEAGMADSVRVECADVFAPGAERVYPGVELVTCFLMMHDLFAAVTDKAAAVRAMGRAFPDAKYFLIGDTVAQPWARHTGPLPVFSLEFELVHAFMGVSLLDAEGYRDAFEAGGLKVERQIPFGTPSTWLYLLSR